VTASGFEQTLDGLEVKPELRKRAAGLKMESGAIDRDTAAMKAGIRRRVVSDCGQVKVAVLAPDKGRLWGAATIEEKRTLLSALFAGSARILRCALRGERSVIPH
jgi:hypothetical protein